MLFQLLFLVQSILLTSGNIRMDFFNGTEFENQTYFDNGYENDSFPFAGIDATTGMYNFTRVTDLVSTTDDQPEKTQQNGFMTEKEYKRHSVNIVHCRIPMSIAGLLANSFIILVFGDRKQKNPTNIYLTAISSLQIISICISLVNVIHLYIDGDEEQKKTRFYYVYNLYVFNYLGVCILRTIYYLVMFLSTERLLAMAFPFRSKYFRIVKNHIVCIFVTFTMALLFRISSLLQYRVVSRTDDDGRKVYGVTNTDYDPEILENFRLASKFIFTYFPLSGILICNITLCYVLHRIKKRRRNLQEIADDKAAQEHQTTLAILISTFIFFIFNLPTVTNAIVGIIRLDYNYFSIHRYLFSFIQELGDLLSLVSFCLDFLTYFIINTKFREEFLARVCFCRRATSNMKPKNTLKRQNTPALSVTRSSTSAIPMDQ